MMSRLKRGGNSWNPDKGMGRGKKKYNITEFGKMGRFKISRLNF